MVQALLIVASIAAVGTAVVLSWGYLCPFDDAERVTFYDLTWAMRWLIGAHLFVAATVGIGWATAGAVLVLIAQIDPWEWLSSRKPAPERATGLSVDEQRQWSDLTSRL